MNTISDEYRALNRSLHENPDYGISGQRWVRQVMELSSMFKTRDILDYGCGKGTLGKNIPYPIHEYDPCVEGKDSRPEPADVVVCTDVLEHIELNCLDAVLDDLRRVTRKVGFFTVATVPAKKVLADGRNAHLIQEPAKWWLPRIMDRFELRSFHSIGPEFLVVVC